MPSERETGQLHWMSGHRPASALRNTLTGLLLPKQPGVQASGQYLGKPLLVTALLGGFDGLLDRALLDVGQVPYREKYTERLRYNCTKKIDQGAKKALCVVLCGFNNPQTFVPWCAADAKGTVPDFRSSRSSRSSWVFEVDWVLQKSVARSKTDGKERRRARNGKHAGTMLRRLGRSTTVTHLYGRMFLAIFFTLPTRTKSVKPRDSRMLSTRSTATLVMELCEEGLVRHNAQPTGLCVRIDLSGRRR